MIFGQLLQTTGRRCSRNYKVFLKIFLSISINTYTNIKKKIKTITILYNKLQYIVLQSFYKGIVKCESNVEYKLTS